MQKYKIFFFIFVLVLVYLFYKQYDSFVELNKNDEYNAVGNIGCECSQYSCDCNKNNCCKKYNFNKDDVDKILNPKPESIDKLYMNNNLHIVLKKKGGIVYESDLKPDTDKYAEVDCPKHKYFKKNYKCYISK